MSRTSGEIHKQIMAGAQNAEECKKVAQLTGTVGNVRERR